MRGLVVLSQSVASVKPLSMSRRLFWTRLFTAGDGSDQKSQLTQFAISSTAHEKDYERRYQRRSNCNGSGIWTNPSSNKAGHCAEAHSYNHEKHCKTWKAAQISIKTHTRERGTIEGSQAATSCSGWKEQAPFEQRFCLNG